MENQSKSSRYSGLWAYSTRSKLWHCDSIISKSSKKRSDKDGWALHCADKESSVPVTCPSLRNPQNDQPGIPSSDYPPGTKLPHVGKSPSPGNVQHASTKKRETFLQYIRLKVHAVRSNLGSHFSGNVLRSLDLAPTSRFFPLLPQCRNSN